MKRSILLKKLENMLKELELSNFRNFKSKKFSFSSNTTVIIGPNASGKTNILEALYLLSTGKSFRARREESTCLEKYII